MARRSKRTKAKPKEAPPKPPPEPPKETKEVKDQSKTNHDPSAPVESSNPPTTSKSDHQAVPSKPKGAPPDPSNQETDSSSKPNDTVSDPSEKRKKAEKDEMVTVLFVNESSKFCVAFCPISNIGKDASTPHRGLDKDGKEATCILGRKGSDGVSVQQVAVQRGKLYQVHARGANDEIGPVLLYGHCKLKVMFVGNRDNDLFLVPSSAIECSIDFTAAENADSLDAAIRAAGIKDVKRSLSDSIFEPVLDFISKPICAVKNIVSLIPLFRRPGLVAVTLYNYSGYTSILSNPHIPEEESQEQPSVPRIGFSMAPPSVVLANGASWPSSPLEANAFENGTSTLEANLEANTFENGTKLRPHLVLKEKEDETFPGPYFYTQDYKKIEFDVDEKKLVAEQLSVSFVVPPGARPCAMVRFVNLCSRADLSKVAIWPIKLADGEIAKLSNDPICVVTHGQPETKLVEVGQLCQARSVSGDSELLDAGEKVLFRVPAKREDIIEVPRNATESDGKEETSLEKKKNRRASKSAKDLADLKERASQSPGGRRFSNGSGYDVSLRLKKSTRSEVIDLKVGEISGCVEVDTYVEVYLTKEEGFSKENWLTNYRVHPLSPQVLDIPPYASIAFENQSGLSVGLCSGSTTKPLLVVANGESIKRTLPIPLVVCVMGEDGKRGEELYLSNGKVIFTAKKGGSSDFLLPWGSLPKSFDKDRLIREAVCPLANTQTIEFKNESDCTVSIWYAHHEKMQKLKAHEGVDPLVVKNLKPNDSIKQPVRVHQPFRACTTTPISSEPRELLDSDGQPLCLVPSFDDPDEIAEPLALAIANAPETVVTIPMDVVAREEDDETRLSIDARLKPKALEKATSQKAPKDSVDDQASALTTVPADTSMHSESLNRSREHDSLSKQKKGVDTPSDFNQPPSPTQENEEIPAVAMGSTELLVQASYSRGTRAIATTSEESQTSKGGSKSVKRKSVSFTMGGIASSPTNSKRPGASSLARISSGALPRGTVRFQNYSDYTVSVCYARNEEMHTLKAYDGGDRVVFDNLQPNGVTRQSVLAQKPLHVWTVTPISSEPQVLVNSEGQPHRLIPSFDIPEIAEAIIPRGLKPRVLVTFCNESIHGSMGFWLMPTNVASTEDPAIMSDSNEGLVIPSAKSNKPFVILPAKRQERKYVPEGSLFLVATVQEDGKLGSPVFGPNKAQQLAFIADVMEQTFVIPLHAAIGRPTSTDDKEARFLNDPSSPLENNSSGNEDVITLIQVRFENKSKSFKDVAVWPVSGGVKEPAWLSNGDEPLARLGSKGSDDDSKTLRVDVGSQFQFSEMKNNERAGPIFVNEAHPYVFTASANMGLISLCSIPRVAHCAPLNAKGTEKVTFINRSKYPVSIQYRYHQMGCRIENIKPKGSETVEVYKGQLYQVFHGEKRLHLGGEPFLLEVKSTGEAVIPPNVAPQVIVAFENLCSHGRVSKVAIWPINVRKNTIEKPICFVTCGQPIKKLLEVGLQCQPRSVPDNDKEKGSNLFVDGEKIVFEVSKDVREQTFRVPEHALPEAPKRPNPFSLDSLDSDQPVSLQIPPILPFDPSILNDEEEAIQFNWNKQSQVTREAARSFASKSAYEATRYSRPPSPQRASTEKTKPVESDNNTTIEQPAEGWGDIFANNGAPTDWKCQVCLVFNEIHANQCMACGKPKGSPAETKKEGESSSAPAVPAPPAPVSQEELKGSSAGGTDGSTPTGGFIMSTGNFTSGAAPAEARADSTATETGGSSAPAPAACTSFPAYFTKTPSTGNFTFGAAPENSPSSRTSPNSVEPQQAFGTPSNSSPSSIGTKLSSSQKRRARRNRQKAKTRHAVDTTVDSKDTSPNSNNTKSSTSQKTGGRQNRVKANNSEVVDGSQSENSNANQARSRTPTSKKRLTCEDSAEKDRNANQRKDPRAGKRKWKRKRKNGKNPNTVIVNNSDFRVSVHSDGDGNGWVCDLDRGQQKEVLVEQNARLLVLDRDRLEESNGNQESQANLFHNGHVLVLQRTEEELAIPEDATSGYPKIATAASQLSMDAHKTPSKALNLEGDTRETQKKRAHDGGHTGQSPPLKRPNDSSTESPQTQLTRPRSNGSSGTDNDKAEATFSRAARPEATSSSTDNVQENPSGKMESTATASKAGTEGLSAIRSFHQLDQEPVPDSGDGGLAELSHQPQSPRCDMGDDDFPLNEEDDSVSINSASLESGEEENGIEAADKTSEAPRTDGTAKAQPKAAMATSAETASSARKRVSVIATASNKTSAPTSKAGNTSQLSLSSTLTSKPCDSSDPYAWICGRCEKLKTRNDFNDAQHKKRDAAIRNNIAVVLMCGTCSGDLDTSQKGRKVCSFDGCKESRREYFSQSQWKKPLEKERFCNAHKDQGAETRNAKAKTLKEGRQQQNAGHLVSKKKEPTSKSADPSHTDHDASRVQEDNESISTIAADDTGFDRDEDPIELSPEWKRYLENCGKPAQKRHMESVWKPEEGLTRAQLQLTLDLLTSFNRKIKCDISLLTYKNNDVLYRLLVGGIICQIKKNPAYDPPLDDKYHWIVKYISEILTNGNGNEVIVEPNGKALCKFQEKPLSDQAIKAILTPYAYNLMWACFNGLSNPYKWMRISDPGYNAFVVRNTSFFKIKLSPEGDNVVLSTDYREAGRCNIVAQLDTSITEFAKGAKDGSNQVIPEDIPEAVKRNYKRNPDYVRMPGGSRNDVPGVDEYEYLKPDVQLSYVQETRKWDCGPKAICSVLDLMPEETQRKWENTVSTLHETLLEIPTAPPPSASTNKYDMVYHNEIRTKTNKALKVSFEKYHDFDPLSSDPSLSCTETPVYGRVKSDKVNHYVAFYRNMLIDPSVGKVLVISKENLLLVGEGSYYGIEHAQKLHLNEKKGKKGGKKRKKNV